MSWVLANLWIVVLCFLRVISINQLFCTLFLFEVFSTLILWMFVYFNIDLHPASRILWMEISELCASPARICPCLAVSGSSGNANLHSLVDIVFPPFDIPTVVGVVLHVGCSWRYFLCDVFLYKYL